MARGWESKSVEEQRSTALENVDGSSTGDRRRHAVKLHGDRQRQLQTLQLQREHILSQKTSSPVRRSALASALAEIEAQIAALG
jgi:hypothetical protein